MATRRRSFHNAPFHRRTWAELLYAVVGLFQAIFGFVYTLVTFVLSAVLAITFIGLPLLTLAGIGNRWLGDGERKLGRSLLGVSVDDPAPFRARPRLGGWIRSGLTDGTAWRARLHSVLTFPVAILAFVVGVALWAYALMGITYWIWQPYLPCNNDQPGGACHRGVNITDRFYIDTWPHMLAFAAAGVLLAFITPWLLHGVLFLNRGLLRGLLGPTAASRRVMELEQRRALAVDDSAASLRRIERDLHDGTQARLVALAMNIGLAREKIASGEDPSAALDSAHQTAKDAIVELRDIARGIHPPALDDGLDSALTTLAARSAVPVQFDDRLVEQPAPAIATIAYFVAAELLTNVARHSDASRATLSATSDAERLRLQVRDNGRGGAQVGIGSGLSGLADRVRTVDGQLRVSSPAGGPTVVDVDLPMHA